MATADTADPGPGLQDAANAFSGLLDREDGTPAPTDTADPPPQDDQPEPKGDDEVVADAETPEEETPPEPKDGEDEPEGDEAADTQDKKPQDEPQKAVPLYTVKVNGKDEQITLDEALKGYSRTRDYTQKTDALATDRHVLQQERSEVQRERSQYAQLLPALVQQLQQSVQQEPDWDALYQQDPLGWAKTRDEWRDKQDKIAAANFEMQRLAQVQEQERQQSLQTMLIDGRNKMLEMNPAWKDGKRWEADRRAIVEYGRTQGYTAEEIAQAYDPRAVVIMDKARRWDELMAKKPTATTQRQGPRVASAGSAPVANSQNQRARQRLAQTGRIEDAARVLQGLLE